VGDVLEFLFTFTGPTKLLLRTVLLIYLKFKNLDLANLFVHCNILRVVLSDRTTPAGLRSLHMARIIDARKRRRFYEIWLDNHPVPSAYSLCSRITHGFVAAAVSGRRLRKPKFIIYSEDFKRVNELLPLTNLS
jgi:hypothetical protein